MNNEARFTAEEIVAALGARHRPASGERGGVCLGVSTDTRAVPAGALFVALKGDRFDAHEFLADAEKAGVWGVVVRRGAGAELAKRVHVFEVPDTLRALGDLARFHRRRFPRLPVVAVTGSNGKTTTKELVAAALSAAAGPGLKTEGNLNNLIGVPLTLFRLTGVDHWAVLEMGMNAPGEIARLTEIAEPTVGVVTNVGPVHLAGLGSEDGVADAKAELYFGLADGCLAVVNADSPPLVQRADTAGATTRLSSVTFGGAAGADVRLLAVEVEGEAGIRFTVRYADGEEVELAASLLGRHNALNACAALAVARGLGLDLRAAEGGLAAASTVGRRLRRADGPGASLVIDDCYNANLTSMEAALETAELLARSRGGAVRAALGDMLELGAAEESMHRTLGERAAGVTRLVAFGPRSGVTAEAARAAGAAAVLHTDDPVAAAEYLAEGLGEGDVVLVKGSRGMAMERIVERLEVPAEATVPAGRGGRR